MIQTHRRTRPSALEVQCEMDDHQARMRFFEKERFRDSLDKGLMRLEEAHATVVAGRQSGRQPAIKRVAAIWDEPVSGLDSANKR